MREVPSAPAGDVGGMLRDLVDGLEAGARLPTERALSADTGASRAAVRHVLALLEAEGRITRHVGRGTFVAGKPTDVAPSVSPAEIMNARLIFEPGILSLVVSAATSKDLQEIVRCVEGGARAASHTEFERWDAAFHRGLAVATHNALILHLYSGIERGREDRVWGGLKRRAFSRDLQATYTEEHRLVVEALSDRDADSAQAAMRAHLLRVRDSILSLRS